MSQRFLLDTHVLLWAVVGDPRFAPHHRRIVEAGEGLVVSVISVWEISIKTSTGKLRFDDDIARIARERSIALLNIDERHAAAVRNLPLRHRDPFDRMLIAQAQVEGLTILTSDRHFAAYAVDLA